MVPWTRLLNRILSEERHGPSCFALGDDFEDAHSACDEHDDEGSPLYAYLIGKAGFHLHLTDFRIRGESEYCDLCVIAEIPDRKRFDPRKFHTIGIKSNRRKVMRAGDRCESPMLIKVRELAQVGDDVERWMGRGVFVRLRLLNECPYRGWHSSDQWFSFYLKLTGVREYRELGSALPLRDCVDDVIEGGTEGLNRLSRHEGPDGRRSLSLGCEDAVLDLLGRSDITLHPRHISVRVLEGPGFPAQLVHTFYAPSEFELSRCLSHRTTPS